MWSRLTFIVTLIVYVLAAPLDERGADVCSSGIYKELDPLKNYPIAVSFCQAKFPPACVQHEARAINARGLVQGSCRKRAVTTITTTSKISTTKVTSTTASTKDVTSSMWAKVTIQPYSIISTFCSCIQPHVVSNLHLPYCQ